MRDTKDLESSIGRLELDLCVETMIGVLLTESLINKSKYKV